MGKDVGVWAASGAQYFSNGVFNVDIDKDDKNEPDNSESDEMDVAQSAKSTPKPRRNTTRRRWPKLPADDVPVPETGFFDGGVKMWRKWEEAQLPLTSYRRWRREHDDEFC